MKKALTSIFLTAMITLKNIQRLSLFKSNC